MVAVRWYVRYDLAGSASAVEPHVFAGAATETTILLGEGRAARFVPVGELLDVDLSPTAAAVWHRFLGGFAGAPSGTGWSATRVP
ncbi:hypothetical protein ACIBF5_24455 [Micromonospora sp. NPDC050417]|uniref:hypothetical protein n=1 Tax=Micromonospora sp. NPDC050417 TaxID=3364280 RepID=UPI00379904ED